ncbi:hypothetical protein GGI07_003094 [Coemansia sp. Benny D115]|nr:hypothetical protein GGI07_003094 [Coemansia sp. Benny D115]
MTKSKSSKQKQHAKKAALKTNGTTHKQTALLSTPVPESIDSLSDNAAAGADNVGQTAALDCIGDLTALSDTVLEKLLQALIDDFDIQEESLVDHKRDDDDDASAVAKANKITSQPAAPKAAIEDSNKDAKRSRASYEELTHENDHLRALLCEREKEVQLLQQMVQAQKGELYAARSQAAQLDSYLMHEIGQIAGRPTMPLDTLTVIRGLQYQYALREEYFMSIETVTKLETMLWQEKCAIAESAVSERDAKICRLSDAAASQQKCQDLLESRLLGVQNQAGAVKRRLERSLMLLLTLLNCNTERKMADERRIGELLDEIEDLTNIKTTMLDYARTAMMRSHKLEDLCRALQAQRKEYLQQLRKLAPSSELPESKPDEPATPSPTSITPPAAPLPTDHKPAPGSLPIVSSVTTIAAAPSKALNAEPTLESIVKTLKSQTLECLCESENCFSQVVDLEPLMSQIATAFPPASMNGKQHVVLGETPRVIRVPRRRNSSTTRRAASVSSVNGMSDGNYKPGNQPKFNSGFAGGTLEFTFSSP